MKNFITTVLITLSIVYISSCKKDCDDNPPPIDSIPDTTDTICHPVMRSLTINDLSFLQFCDSSDILFFNQDSTIADFTDRLNVHDTSFSCTNGHEFWILNYGSDSLNWRIIYNLGSTYNDPLNLDIRIGPPSPTGEYYKTYEIGTDSFPDYDSLNLSGKMFYDVYKAHPVLVAFPDLYFTKEQGVVGFYDFSGNYWVLKE